MKGRSAGARRQTLALSLARFCRVGHREFETPAPPMGASREARSGLQTAVNLLRRGCSHGILMRPQLSPPPKEGSKPYAPVGRER